jgi:hypothetical protein
MSRPESGTLDCGHFVALTLMDDTFEIGVWLLKMNR